MEEVLRGEVCPGVLPLCGVPPSQRSGPTTAYQISIILQDVPLLRSD